MSALTVTQLSAHIKGLLDQDALLRDVWVEGEASNCKEAVSGHWYFTLKDPGASLSCVMWKGQAALQSYLPEDGRAFQMHGVVSAYPAQGKYQLMVDQIEPLGQGDLHREFERIKAKLDAEGLFDPARKRRLPPYPRRIGLVTSPGAAALQDVLKVLGRRWPVAELFLAPTLVQGDAAPPQIVAALQAIGRAGVDVVLLIRGGGSLEDLWAFNDERVARAIVDCPVPVVSGVGHEIDFSIADFVADLRAPTPSAAAELATPDAWELRQRVDGLQAFLTRKLVDQLAQAREGHRTLTARLGRAAPQRGLAEQRRAMAQLVGRLQRAAQADLRLRRSQTQGLAEGLSALSPQAVLARGYAHVRRLRDGRTVSSTADVGPAEGLNITVADGQIAAVTAGQGRLF
ncbi:MAG: exodeoxyribonuclease VII large subunit [Ardenticatenia bacterium]|nr:exodeoxyribonuclease VII large subunit [Ardenticatenia bacterium]